MKFKLDKNTCKLNNIHSLFTQDRNIFSQLKQYIVRHSREIEKERLIVDFKSETDIKAMANDEFVRKTNVWCVQQEKYLMFVVSSINLNGNCNGEER
jgi:hypothetical protein